MITNKYNINDLVKVECIEPGPNGFKKGFVLKTGKVVMIMLSRIKPEIGYTLEFDENKWHLDFFESSIIGLANE